MATKRTVLPRTRVAILNRPPATGNIDPSSTLQKATLIARRSPNRTASSGRARVVLHRDVPITTIG